MSGRVLRDSANWCWNSMFERIRHSNWDKNSLLLHGLLLRRIYISFITHGQLQSIIISFLHITHRESKVRQGNISPISFSNTSIFEFIPASPNQSEVRSHFSIKGKLQTYNWTSCKISTKLKPIYLQTSGILQSRLLHFFTRKLSAATNIEIYALESILLYLFGWGSFEKPGFCFLRLQVFLRGGRQ